jgi:hypothetical protein
MIRLVILSILAISLIGCDTKQTVPAPSLQGSAARPEPAQVSLTIPLPVHEFDAFCVSTNGEHERALRVAQARKLDRAPPDLVALGSSGADPDQASSFIIQSDKHSERLMLVSAAKNNTCGLYALGYGASETEAALRKHYRLLLLEELEQGTQVQRLFIPDGESRMRSEVAQKGIIAIGRSKDPAATGDAVLLNYIPPTVASQVFK